MDSFWQVLAVFLEREVNRVKFSCVIPFAMLAQPRLRQVLSALETNSIPLVGSFINTSDQYNTQRLVMVVVIRRKVLLQEFQQFWPAKFPLRRNVSSSICSLSSKYGF